mmetsp:Transcript_16119/g.62868  ORF Transcript_16119/g.62868 Transcript_16119/m.62868 type:complete len:112 (+) Transcript_16119:31-366(+)
MGKSVRSKRMKRLRHIKRDKVDFFYKANLEQLSKALQQDDINLSVEADVGPGASEEQKKEAAQELLDTMDTSVEKTGEVSLNKAIKGGKSKHKRRRAEHKKSKKKTKKRRD